MKRSLTISLLGLLLAIAPIAAPTGASAKSARLALAVPKAATAPATLRTGMVLPKPGKTVRTVRTLTPGFAQYDRKKRRFFPRRVRPRPRGMFGAPRRGVTGQRLMTMGEAVRMVRARFPGRIVKAALRGRIAAFRVISNGRLYTVYVDRLRRTMRVSRGFS